MNKLLRNPAIRQLCSYLIVGGIATVIEWICFYILSYKMQIQYLVATGVAFAISTAANWAAGRLLTFRNAAKQSIISELAKIYAASVVGLLFNLILMFIFVQKAEMVEMVGKIMATIIVFAWNFIVRKFVIYR